jgi:putative hemolysin
MHTPLVVILPLVLLLGLFSMAETALATARKWRLRERASRGQRGAAAALRLSENLERSVSSMRLGITLAATAAGSYAGACLGQFLKHNSGGSHAALTQVQIVVIGVVFLAFVLTTFLLGELIPRRIALHHPEQVATWLARPVEIFSLLSGPLMRALGTATDALVRLLGAQPLSRPAVTQEEIKGLLWEGTKAGVFDEAEHEIFKRVFRFCDRRARALMTPRNKVDWIDVSDPPEEIRRKVVQSPHSLFPVCDGSLDNLLGIVQVKDLLAQNSGGSPFRLKGHLTLPAFIYERTRGPQVIETLKKSATHTAVVLDEYGSVVGIVTLNDILEAVLGDLPEHDREEEPRVVERADGSRLLDGRFPLDEFRELFNLDQTPDGDFHTLAGLVVTQLGHIPRISESFECMGLRFEVVEMDSQRVDRVLVTRVPKRK